jgi:NADH dehydrogenase (ubiquinone) 1 beta subcomplex subunit 7
MYVTREELIRKKVPIHYRDYCAHLYIEWMDCVYNSGHCEKPKMAWEKCQYDEYSFIINLKKVPFAEFTLSKR